MERFALSLLMLSVLCGVALGGSIARSSSYTGYGYARQSPPAVAANGSGRRSAYYGGSADTLKPAELTKANAVPEKKTGGSGMSAWGIIAIIVSVCLSLMGVYYFTIFYPILCKKQRKYDVMELGSQ